jgi:hypothetical protein
MQKQYSDINEMNLDIEEMNQKTTVILSQLEEVNGRLVITYKEVEVEVEPIQFLKG